jgi:uncharacterized protein (UPF0261 family)
VFHATGTGGRAMQARVDGGFLAGVLDVTTTELCDELVGGVLSAGPDRLEAAGRGGIPQVVSLGALDMVNFGARQTVDARNADRRLHVHNAQVTLMRTTPEENRRIARWIAGKLNRATAPVVVLIPEGGVSMLDAPGQPFHDPPADTSLFDELETCLHQDALRRIIRLPYHVNDAPFAERLVSEFLDLWQTETAPEASPSGAPQHAAS